MARVSNNTALNIIAEGTGSAFLAKVVKKTVTFTGAASHGAVGTVAVATITGAVELQIVPFCTVDLASAGGGTIVLGTATTSNVFLASTTATALDVGEFWLSSTPASAVDTSGIKKWTVAENVIITVGTGDVTAGSVDFYIHWRPISSDGNVA